MKKKTLPLLGTLFLLVFCLPNNVFSETTTVTAKGLVAVESYSQAIPLLAKHIKENPGDAEAHYLLGVCFLNTGRYKYAKEQFARAVNFDKGYGQAIGSEYSKIGRMVLDKGTYGMAGILFKRAIEYDPDLQKEIGRQYFEVGKLHLGQQEHSKAERLFAIAIQYDPSLQAERDRISSD